MALSSGRKAGVAVLVILGIYFLVWHYPPLPGNHEAILGKDHIVYAVIGIVLLIGAIAIVVRARRSAAPAGQP